MNTHSRLQKLFRIPLLFFFIAACLGLFLRYLIVSPVPGLSFTYVLHGHSHVMFLGWVFNILFLGFVSEFTDGKGYTTLFWILQVLVVGMLISFPLQGYGAFSIIFSTLHTLVAFAFIVRFFKSTRTVTTVGVWLARVALMFFVLSSIGPFYLGYLKANEPDQSILFRCAIYFYLHFQYNGFFFFGILSLLVKLMETDLDTYNIKRLKNGCLWLVIACIPAYVLSVLWAKPGVAFNFIGVVVALVQLFGAILVFRSLRQWWSVHKRTLYTQTAFLFKLVLAALVLKLLLQLASSDPGLALFVDEYRPIVIAYLHLVLIGVVTIFLIGWLIQKRILKQGMTFALWIFIGGFVISQLLILFSPWVGSLTTLNILSYHKILFLVSLMMVAGVGWMVRSAFMVRS